MTHASQGNGDHASTVAAIRILEVELSGGLEAIEPLDERGRRHASAWVLVRLHAEPIGMVQTPLPDGGLSAAELGSTIEKELGERITAHLHGDGLTRRDLEGAEGTPRCVQEREDFLRDAPFLSVIIPTRERPERLERCVRSILASGYPSTRYEILAVDNAPATDATRQLVESMRAEGAPIRYARENATGSASARNAGLPLVESDIVVMTDDDTIVDHHWLTEVARGFASAADVACVSGLLLPGELETPAQIWFEEYGGFSRGFDQRIFDLEDNRPPEETLYPYSAGIFGTGNNFAFRRQVLQDIGGFDPALGNGTPALGGVDSEVLLRTILTGHRIVYRPSALVWHLHRPGIDGLRSQIYAYGVGLTAYLLKTMLANPRVVPDFLSRVPRGAWFALSPTSSKNAQKSPGYPSDLTRLELKGMLYGPLAYARSRRRYGPHTTATAAYKRLKPPRG